MAVIAILAFGAVAYMLLFNHPAESNTLEDDLPGYVDGAKPASTQRP